MNLNALQKLGYGMYIVGSHKENKLNGQVANTVFQITSEPATVAVSINKKNLTNEYIKASRVFSQGAAQRLAHKFEAPLLGDVPLDPAVCAAGEDGTPLVLAQPQSLPAQALTAAARKLAQRLEAPLSKQ